MKKLLLLLLFLGVFFLGVWIGKEPTPEQAAVHPEKEFPVADKKPFVIIAYASNDAFWCKRALRSIFEQEYGSYRVLLIDDGSEDKTYEIAHSFILENNQDHRVILMRNEKPLGPVASLYRAVDHLLDHEIVLPLSVRDWLANPSALTQLNHAYQNPDVWLTCSTSFDYPSYEKSADDLAYTFYAGLFRKIRLGDLFRESHFVKSHKSYLDPLVEMAGGRIRFLNEPITFTNHSLTRYEPLEQSLPTYSPLAAFPHPLKDQQADVLLFSLDRPMQLYACLESIERYVTGASKISVLYRTSHKRFDASYDKVKEAFPNVRFLRQSERKDFKPLLLKTVFNSPSKYILFGTDDIITKDFVDLKLCMEMLEKTGAYGFYLRFGKHIRFCYQIKQPQEIPESFSLGQSIFAWNLKTAEHDWKFPNTVDMTLYRKKDLKKAFEKISYKSPTGLEFNWANDYAPEDALGLYFEHSKVVNIPLNIVDRTGNPHMNAFSAEDLLTKFEEGLKFDIDPLYKIENPSPHFEYTPEFIVR